MFARSAACTRTLIRDAGIISVHRIQRKGLSAQARRFDTTRPLLSIASAPASSLLSAASIALIMRMEPVLIALMLGTGDSGVLKIIKRAASDRFLLSIRLVTLILLIRILLYKIDDLHFQPFRHDILDRL
jgi:hypothetical protein